MDFSNSLTFRVRQPDTQHDPSPGKDTPRADKRESTCPNLAAFLAICFANGDESLGLHPVLTNASPSLDDVSLRGGSFDVRKVKASSFPLRLADDLFRGRDFVVVKHPRPGDSRGLGDEVLSEVGMELQVLRHWAVRRNENVIDLLAVMYHDAGDEEGSIILPALVLEYAAFGNLKTFQEEGNGHSFEDKIDIAIDTAKGIEALHACGVIHGDVKNSNMLVCKHPTRKFIVKVSDFGFSFLVTDSQLTGHTEIYCPPESYTAQLDPEQAKQVDVYCYGLLLHSVLKDGTAYYPQGPDAPVGTAEDFQKMKVSGLMPATLLLNVLMTGPGREPYPLLLLCKVLLYCLLPEPKQRWRDMTTIISLLSLLQGCNDQPNKSASEKVSAALGAATEAGKGGGDLLASLTTVIRAMLSTMDGQMLTAGPEPIRRQFLATVSTFADTVVANFVASVGELEMPMFEVVGAQLRARAQKQLSEITQGSESGPSFLITRLFFSLPSELALCRGHDLIPDFSLLHGIFQKMPWPVQKAAVQSLSHLHSTTKDKVAKRKAALSLASVYTNGVGVEPDLTKASALVLEAAKLGDERAQTIYINGFFPESSSPPDVDELTWRTWLSESAMAGNAIALSKLSSLDPAALPAISEARRQAECSVAKSGLGEGRDGSLASLDGDVPSDQLQCILLSAVINDNRPAIEKCLELDENLPLTRYHNGEHALLIACRLGNAHAATALISPSTANLADEQGARPFHWLSRLAEDQHRVMARLLKDNGADPDALGPALTRSDVEQRVQPGRLRWTPLHWAVALDSPSAVRALMEIGCDPTIRAAPDRGTWDLSPLELASSLCNSASLAALLTNDAVRSQVDKPRPMVEGMAVSITPMFYVVSSRSRWDRIRKHGLEFKKKTRETLKLLIDNGASSDRVLLTGSQGKMPAVFATAYHSCCADVMASGLELGFGSEMDASCGSLSSGGSALFLAITHRDRAMFTALVEAGASLDARDEDGMTPLHRAAKENDDVFFARALLDAGVPVEPGEDSPIPTPFQVAVYCRNFAVAKLLFDSGAERDRMAPRNRRTILGDMLSMHTWNSLERVKFVLNLPDRSGDAASDGFIAARIEEKNISVFHLAAPYISETSSHRSDITAILVTQLLGKYSEKKHLDSTYGPFSMTAVAVAVENGDYGVVRKLLDAGADPNVADEFGRSPLDLLYHRYCYPENLPSLEEVDCDDKLAVGRTLQSINENTAEVLSLLKSHRAEARTFCFPNWHHVDSGYRNAAWVMDRLKEKKERKVEAEKKEKKTESKKMEGGPDTAAACSPGAHA
ncbi:hypothetical protein CDD80_380 [Ophiocordyceps camponoti-rufipedis]|uniref:Protein kinase domain-containing protein n=1 Tax=Ophiocordyceps camponoti-rufipedis TaxID=2004952 RepID=A0A2C5ZCX1_9HYPO|nr:hypothetical protein CDD80_380 [Ophiocordyceps camponoti-rufipedis]